MDQPGACTRLDAEPRIAPAVFFWVALVLPSLYVVHKFGGWTGVAVYLPVAAAGVYWCVRSSWPRSERAAGRLAAATWLVLAISFAVMYPTVNVHTAGAGSDDDDAYNVGALALATGHSPYAQKTYLGNELHQLPGSFLLALPFVMAGTSALQNLFWIPAFFVSVAKYWGDRRAALRFSWAVLALSPTVLHEIVTGTGHVANTIMVLLGLFWLTHTERRDVAATMWGVTLASRANFLFLIPLAAGWIHQRQGWRAAARALAITCGTTAALSLPFYWSDPRHFGPLNAIDRLERFNQVLPFGAFATLAVMLGLSIALATRPMNDRRLFANGAIVQGVPVLAGILIGSLSAGVPDLVYATYGTFAAWFVMAATFEPLMLRSA